MGSVTELMVVPMSGCVARMTMSRMVIPSLGG